MTAGPPPRKEAIAAYEEVERRYASAPEPELREQAAKALFNRGLTLNDLRRADEGATCLRQLVEQFGAATEPAIQQIVAKAREALAGVS